MLPKLQKICLLVFLFHVSNTCKSSNGFLILIISFISLIEINKLNPFPPVTVPFPHIFLSNLFIAFEVKLIQVKLSLAKRILISAIDFFPNLHNQEPKDSPD